MKPIDQIIDEVEATQQARRDAKRKREEALDCMMNEICEQFGWPAFRTKFDQVRWAQLGNGIDIEISRGGDLVCHLLKEDGTMTLKSLVKLGPPWTSMTRKLPYARSSSCSSSTQKSIPASSWRSAGLPASIDQ